MNCPVGSTGRELISDRTALAAKLSWRELSQALKAERELQLYEDATHIRMKRLDLQLLQTTQMSQPSRPQVPSRKELAQVCFFQPQQSLGRSCQARTQSTLGRCLWRLQGLLGLQQSSAVGSSAAYDQRHCGTVAGHQAHMIYDRCLAGACVAGGIHFVGTTKALKEEGVTLKARAQASSTAVSHPVEGIQCCLLFERVVARWRLLPGGSRQKQKFFTASCLQVI